MFVYNHFVYKTWVLEKAKMCLLWQALVTLVISRCEDRLGVLDVGPERATRVRGGNGS